MRRKPAAGPQEHACAAPKETGSPHTAGGLAGSHAAFVSLQQACRWCQGTAPTTRTTQVRRGSGGGGGPGELFEQSSTDPWGPTRVADERDPVSAVGSPIPSPCLAWEQVVVVLGFFLGRTNRSREFFLGVIMQEEERGHRHARGPALCDPRWSNGTVRNFRRLTYKVGTTVTATSPECSEVLTECYYNFLVGT